ncbi:protein FAR-RED IMPAIRED RESPONSE 1-like [Silene latifolia]|uniref:protein FAR-RED IMPAIRED RESPONSE 1-like n=1 Tax=Silene latifolia TaxID=37657 RepID=UPI003D772A47
MAEVIDIVQVTNVQGSSINSQGDQLLVNNAPHELSSNNVPATPEVVFDNPIVGLPRCSAELKPALWIKFATLEEGIHFYEKYAKVVGFLQDVNRELHAKKAMSPSFFFDFDVDDQSRITKLFWADPISLKNYALFGDVVFVDATYNFNQYKMVFVPFTGVDNYKGCITFVAGLIRNENAESFSWLFQNFITAMGDRYPFTIITDQCRGIKKAVKGVFDDKTRHRLCMWHIMKKLPDKMFERIGILCRHVLWVLKDRGFDHIPKEYLALRWSKSATSHPLSNVVETSVLADCVSIESRQNNISGLWSEVFNAVSLVEDNEEHCDALFQLLRSFNEKLIISVKSGKSKDKKAEIEMLLGSKIPTEATVLPPEKCKNKVSGKRITSNKEKAVLENAKPLRKCRACGEMSNQDSRNCPSRLP